MQNPKDLMKEFEEKKQDMAKPMESVMKMGFVFGLLGASVFWLIIIVIIQWLG